ncbi:MAG: hypothetical protein ACOZCL_17905 [Bacillota bacterium]
MRIIVFLLIICLLLPGCSSKIADNSQSNEQAAVSSEQESLEESSNQKPEDMIIVDDISNWKHPVKSVLENNNIRIIKLELTDNKTYPTFYVVFPSEISKTEYAEKVIKSISEANGYWDYTILDESNAISINVTNDKKNKSVVSYILNGIKTDISDNSINQPEYKKYFEFLNVNEKAVKFFKEDIDLDGKQEVIIAFGEEYCTLKVYILREAEDKLQEIGQIEGQGYGVYDINLVKMRGADNKYIEATISNGAGLEGFALYRVNKDSVDMIAYSASATGAGYDILTSTTKDGIYDGYVQSRYSYDVMYFDVKRYYEWNGEYFEYISASVDVGDYPNEAEAVVEHFLKLNMLWDEDKESNDVIKRLSEINISNKLIDTERILEVVYEDSHGDWLIDLQIGTLKFTSQQNTDSIIVTIPVQNQNMIFRLIKNNKMWQIVDIEGDFVINGNNT